MGKGAKSGWLFHARPIATTLPKPGSLEKTHARRKRKWEPRVHGVHGNLERYFRDPAEIQRRLVFVSNTSPLVRQPTTWRTLTADQMSRRRHRERARARVSYLPAIAAIFRLLSLLRKLENSRRDRDVNHRRATSILLETRSR